MNLDGYVNPGQTSAIYATLVAISGSGAAVVAVGPSGIVTAETLVDRPLGQARRNEGRGLCRAHHRGAQAHTGDP